MPLIIPSNSISAGGYEVDNSLRFNDGSSDYLARTNASATNNTKYTYSVWVKRATLGTNQSILYNWYDGGNHAYIFFATDDKLALYDQLGGTDNINMKTSAVFRDVSAWYNIVVKVDTTESTQANRVRIFINGVEDSIGTRTSQPSSSASLGMKTNSLTNYMAISSFVNSSINYLDGYIAEAVYIDGTALDPTSFGEFDADTGIWKPIDVSGLTFGTNGFYLDFENSGSLGADVSGNGNNFTVNNLTSIDQTTDTPTNNFATLNPLVKSGSQTYANGNTEIVSIGDNDSVVSSIGTDTMKFYFEVKLSSTYDGSGGGIDAGGIREEQFNSSGFNSGTWSGFNLAYSKFYGNGNDGRFKEGNGTVVTGGLTRAVAGDIIMIAIDAANNRVYAGVNGTWLNSSDPVAGTGYIGGTATTGTGIWFGYHSSDLDKGDCFVNYGNPAYTISSGNSDANGYGNFEYAVPSGYYALCTKNLAEFG